MLRSAFRILILLWIAVWPAVVSADHPAAARLPGETAAPSGRIVIKFTAESGLFVEQGVLGPVSPAADRIARQLAITAPGFDLVRHFTRTPAELESERLQAEARSGHTMPHLNSYAHLDPGGAAPSREELLAIVAALRGDPAIETAFLEPVAVPAALGFDAFTGRFEPGPAAAGLRALRTPDFSDLQGYLDPAPDGVDAEGVWDLDGGRGQGVKVLDIEGAWLWEHEDLPDPFFTAGGQIPSQSWRNHGTAVAGEIRSINNGYGVTGISHEVEVGGVSIAGLTVADAINTAAANLDLGDIYLIELHAPGPNATGVGQFGYVCMEYWQDIFDAIQVASAHGRICCEAAGNGEQDLDDPVYNGLFDRNVRDSGAIICGASYGGQLHPAAFTNYGSRVDLHGWGYFVVSTGYGNLQGGDETEWYTDTFSGTSSASPIVLGAVACLQGMVKALWGLPLEARLARDILVATGTPQTGEHHIGPRPDLTAAWVLVQEGIGAVSGVVTDLASGLPLAGVWVRAEASGAFTRSAADGSYRLPFPVGTCGLTFDSFFHEVVTDTAQVSAGATSVLNVALPLRPTATIGGRTLADDGLTPLSAVRIAPLGVPLPGASSGPDGAWSLSGVPVGRTYEFLFDNLPGYGAEFDSLPLGPADTLISWFNVQIAPAAEDFENGPGGFVGDSAWAHGTPTAGGPDAGFSGQSCWGVGMHANYGDDLRGYLTSPSFDFSGEDVLYLSFHYWCETETDFDGANLQVWNPGTSGWEVLIPLTGYSSLALSGIDYQPGWSGSTGGWVGAVFDLSERISEEVAFRVAFGSDGYVNDLGFWVDEICFDTGDVFSAVAPTMPAVAFGIRGVTPNPFPAAGQIALGMPAAAQATIAVFDAAGRRIRRVHEGPLPGGVTRILWDGRDDRGRLAPSGVYFVRLDSGRRAAARQIVLVRR